MIYFIQDTGSGAIKIGVSKNPVKRLAGLQTAHSCKLNLVGIMEGTEQDEQALHRLFTQKRGEWFEPTRDLLAFIRENTVSVSALSAIRRPRSRRSRTLDAFKPELQGDGYLESMARLAVHIGDVDFVVKIATESYDSLVQQHGASAVEQSLGYNGTFEDARAKVQQLVDIQNARNDPPPR